MHDLVAVAGADDGDVVDALGGVWEEVGDFEAALTVLAEFSLRAEEAGVGAYELVFGFAEFVGLFLAVELIEQLLGIARVDVAGGAGHEAEDARFGLCVLQ